MSDCCLNILSDHIRPNRAFSFVIFAAFVLVAISSISAQRLAVISPEPGEEADIFADGLAARLSAHFRVIERSAAETAFDSLSIDSPFNQTTEETSRAGALIGADMIIYTRVITQRRSSFERDKYFESSAAIFVTGARSGKLHLFQLVTAEEDSEEKAFSSLLLKCDEIATTIAVAIPELYRKELSAKPINKISDHSRGNGQNDDETKPPMPYRRISPRYTSEAFLFGIQATVDVEVDVSDTGNVTNIHVIRWAGYGLERSVAAAIREMNWRPAEHKGKNLPMRVMLRYNFTKAEKAEN